MLVTNLIVGVCVVVFGGELLLQAYLSDSLPAEEGGGGLMGVLGVSGLVAFLMGSNVHEVVVEHWQGWRLITACYLHFGLIHIGFNCMALRTLGQLAEGIWGKARFWSGYWISGLLGSSASLVWQTFIWNDPKNSAGASGAVFGVLGMLFGLTLRHGNRINPAIRKAVREWVFFCLIFGVMVGADNAGHVGGLVAGGIIGFLVTPPRFAPPSPWGDRGWSAMALLGIVLTVFSFGAAGRFLLQAMLEAGQG